MKKKKNTTLPGESPGFQFDGMGKPIVSESHGI